MNNDWRTLEPYDWRYSAAITGIIRYFKYFDEKKDDWKIENECLIYNPASITQHDYLKFVEDNYPEDMAHLIIENMIHQDDLNEEQIKFLLQFECPLSVCYDAWLKTDVSYMEILHVAVNNLTEGLIADDTI